MCPFCFVSPAQIVCKSQIKLNYFSKCLHFVSFSLRPVYASLRRDLRGFCERLFV